MPPPFLRPFLWPFSFFYRMGLAIDRFLGSRCAVRLPRPVISIGNLTVGGTGKTPLLAALCSRLQEEGRRPAVLTRGYRGLMKGSGLNDETTLLKNRMPGLIIGTGSDRAASAAELLEKNRIDVFLLDDGFQHWKIRRDVDVVCVDTTDPWGGSRLLPAGRLREPVEALSRATVVVLTRTDQAGPEAVQAVSARVERYVPRDRILRSHFRPSVWEARMDGFSPASLPPERALAVSGLGNPAAFERTLADLRMRVHPFRFPDHHAYTETDAARIQAAAKKESAAIVTTEKDWVKLRALRGIESILPLFVVKVELAFDEKDDAAWRRLTAAVFS